MQDDRVAHQRSFASWIRIAAILALAGVCWLARIRLPGPSAALELDPSYQQALGVALTQGLRFGREIVFTSGPLAYFTAAPFDAELYWAKLWLWEVALGGTVALLFFWRLVQDGTWIDVALGALGVILLPRTETAWLFTMGLVAADLGLRCMGASPRIPSPWLRAACATVALLVLSILTMVKVGSLSFALAVLAILLARAAASGGPRSALRWFAAWIGVECALWLCIGQELQDLPLYFWTSIELASGFDAAMSVPAAPLFLGLAAACMIAGIGLCVLHARRRGGAARSEFFDTPRAQALLVAVALLLAYKAGFVRADRHILTFFTAAVSAPLFLIAFERAGAARSAWRESGRRGCVVVLTAICGFAAGVEEPRSPAAVLNSVRVRMLYSMAWITKPGEVLDRMARSRAELQAAQALPRIKAIVGTRSISAFSIADAVLFLNQLAWKPRPVFQSFSVFTQRSARANAEFLAGSDGPDFLLLRVGNIDGRLPSSEDPLALQVLLKCFRPRANEGGFLLLERAAPRVDAPREELAYGVTGWNERVEVPQDGEPLVLRARIHPSLAGRARAALYQTPAVSVEVELESGASASHRVAPFALEAGVVLRPWLPANESWIARARGEKLDTIVAMVFRTGSESAFAPRIDYEFERAPDLRAAQSDPTIVRELILGAAGELPLRYESPVEPLLVGWHESHVMLLATAPASLCFPSGPGAVRLRGKLMLPPWIARAPDFPGVLVQVNAVEAGATRACAEVVLQKGGTRADSPEIDLEADERFAVAGELRLEIRALPGGDPWTAAVGIRELRLER